MSRYIIRTVVDYLFGEDDGTEDAIRLVNYLWKNNRGEDAIKAEDDFDYFLKLLSEYYDKYPFLILDEDEDEDEDENEDADVLLSDI